MVSLRCLKPPAVELRQMFFLALGCRFRSEAAYQLRISGPFNVIPWNTRSGESGQIGSTESR